MPEQKLLIHYLICYQMKIKMNESGALVNGYDEKSKSEDNKKESTYLDIVADIGENICDTIGSILD